MKLPMLKEEQVTNFKPKKENLTMTKKNIQDYLNDSQVLHGSYLNVKPYGNREVFQEYHIVSNQGNIEVLAFEPEDHKNKRNETVPASIRVRPSAVLDNLDKAEAFFKAGLSAVKAAKEERKAAPSTTLKAPNGRNIDMETWKQFQAFIQFQKMQEGQVATTSTETETEEERLMTSDGRFLCPVCKKKSYQAQGQAYRNHVEKCQG